MSTLRVSNIEAKADVSSPTVDEKIKFTNSSGDVLFHLDGKTSGITTVGINTTGNTFTVNNTTGDVSFSGSVTSSGVSTFSSDVSIADKIVHIGDTDTAIRFPAADTITAETGGTERFRITSSGNIGIGLTNPQTALVVERDWVNNYGSINIKSSSNVLSGIGFRTDGGYAGGFIYRDGTTGNFFELNAQGSREIRALLNGSEAFRVDTGGRLLLGTTSDKSIGSDANALVQIFTGSAGKLLLGREDSIVVGDEYIGLIDFHSTDGGSERCARISCQAEEIHGTGTKASRLSFMTSASGSATPTERLRIASTGAFGLSGANYGTSGQVLTSQGSSAAPQLATPAASWTSASVNAGPTGGVVAFTSIPSDIDFFIMSWNNVNSTANSTYAVEMGHSGSYQTSGYNVNSGYLPNGTTNPGVSRYTTSFFWRGSAGGGNNFGRIWFSRHNTGNVWHAFGNAHDDGSDIIYIMSGSCSLGGTLDRIRLILGSGGFDTQGSVTLQYLRT